jgi:hypothetical protein
MAMLNPEQIARYAYDAGFRGDGLVTAVAVALAESGGDTKAHNDKGLDDSYGLWQINMYGSLGPDRRRDHDLDSNRELWDPEVNAEVANAISKDGKDWTLWATYEDGLHRPFLDEARRAARAVTRENANDNRGGNRGNGNGGGGQGGQGNGGQGGSGSFAVDTDLLIAYVRRTRGLADSLDSAGTRHLRRIREIADDSFGKIGKESGFAAALDSFTAALHRQVRGVSDNADKLAKSTSRTVRAYRDRDDEIAGHLAGIQPGS